MQRWTPFIKKHSIKIASVLLVIFIGWCGYIVYQVDKGRESIGDHTYQMYTLNLLSDQVMTLGQYVEKDSIRSDRESREFLMARGAEIDSLMQVVSGMTQVDVSPEMEKVDSLLFSKTWEDYADRILKDKDIDYIILQTLESIEQAKQKVGFSFGMIGARLDPLWYQLYIIVGISCLLGIFLALLVKKQRESISIIQKARQEAESAARMKSEFLAVMSHEIRTPLNAVVGMSDLLQQSDLDQEYREYAQTIKKGGENLLSVINDVLDYSKLEAGHLELESRPYNVVELIEDILDLMAVKAAQKQVELLYYVDDNVPSAISGDETRLRQVLINLVGNALKFTNQGEVLIHLERANDGKDETKLKFSVHDTGIGIPQEKIDKLFQSFTQLDSTTTRKYGGTGLGLAICKRIVNLMGGEIWVESEEGKGSTFFFTINAEPTERQHSRQGNVQELPDLKILLLDDNETNLKILQKQCSRWGMETVSFQEPDSALEYVENNKDIDVAFIDMQLDDEMNGLQFYREVKSKAGETPFQAILLTSLGDVSMPDAKKEFDQVLNKPVRDKTLHKALRDVLEISSQTQEKRRAVPGKSKSVDQLSEGESSITILIAEDDRMNQKVAEKLFEKLGFSVDLVTNGQQVVEAAQDRRYDLILMDIQMPKKDGYEATRQIRENISDGQNQPVIISMTAQVLDDVHERCMQAGMDDYITKPVELESLKEIIKKWFPEEEEVLS